MRKEDVIKSIRELSHRVLPVWTQVILLGSQATNNANSKSDWDVLILLNKRERANNQDFDDVAFPLIELGWEIGAMINPIVYSLDDWKRREFTPFYKNVMREGLELC